MKRKRKHPIVVDRKLGRYKVEGYPVHGFCDDEGLIEIEPRQKAKDYLGTLIHELLHHLLPGATEKWVEESEAVMTKEIWKKGYRRTVR